MKRMKRNLLMVVFFVFSICLLKPMQANAAPKLKISDKKLHITVGQKKTLSVKNAVKKVKWTSSNKKVVKVSTKGIVRGVKKGNAVITAKVGKKSVKCKVFVKDAVVKIKETVKIKDAGFIMLNYFSDSISCKSNNPKVASIYITETGPSDEDEDSIGNEAVLAIYGHKKGTATITVRNNCNNKKMKFKVKISVTKPKTGEEKLIRHIIKNGALDENYNKYISLDLAADTIEAANGAKEEFIITYDYWEKTLEYKYIEVNSDGKIEWSFLEYDDTDDKSIVIWITPHGREESDYVTASSKITDYNGETLVFEEGWFGIPADDMLQPIANDATKKAMDAMNELLKQLDLTVGDVL